MTAAEKILTVAEELERMDREMSPAPFFPGETLTSSAVYDANRKSVASFTRTVKDPKRLRDATGIAALRNLAPRLAKALKSIHERQCPGCMRRVAFFLEEPKP